MTSKPDLSETNLEKKAVPALPSVRRLIGMLLLFAAIGLSSCQSLFVSLTPGTSAPSSISTEIGK